MFQHVSGPPEGSTRWARTKTAGALVPLEHGGLTSSSEVTDVYFLAGYYGLMEVLVDEIKRLTTNGCLADAGDFFAETERQMGAIFHRAGADMQMGDLNLLRRYARKRRYLHL